MNEKINNKYSVTSNIPKLLKHLPKLYSFQKGISKPIMIHLMVTNQCNLNCESCCFSSSNNDGKYLSLDRAKDIMRQFSKLGTKAVEITGAGDFTMYKDINKLIIYLKKLGYSIGGNTNGVFAKRITEWDKFTWVRLSMNTLDFYSLDKAYPLDYIRSFKPTPDITGCYVWNSKGNENLEKVVNFANKEKIITRIVPNCIQTKENIDKELKHIIGLVSSFKNNKYVFASDHNVDLDERRNNNCYIHHIKPCVFTDGWVYSCPSSELSMENGITLKKEFRICEGKDVYEYYTNNFEVKKRDCYFCKYKEQNEFLEDLLMRTKHDEFA